MADAIIMLNPTVLKEHPRNDEFFDKIDGADFDRLVESIKEHGILTPLRVTKDMILISGHQRKRAAIEAGLTEVPVIFDESTDDNEVLTKLIETNFGRMKNDPIKQARWIKEYEELRGVRQGSAKTSFEPNNSAQKVSQADIAKELGVSRDSIQNLKKLLTLDPAIQQLISEGNISPTTGFKLIAKLSPEDQIKLLAKLSDDVKFSDKAVKAKIDEIREQGAANANAMQEENDKLRGRNENLIRENNELRAGKIDVSEATQSRIKTLEEEKREFYEKAKHYEGMIDHFRGQLDLALQAKANAEAKAKGGDDAVLAYENQIDELQKQITTIEREKDDLEFQLEEKNDEIRGLKQEKNDGFMRTIVSPDMTSGEHIERQVNSFKVKTINTVNAFENAVNDIMRDVELLGSTNADTIKALYEVTENAINHAKMLHNFFGRALTLETTDADSDTDDFDYDSLIATGVSA